MRFVCITATLIALACASTACAYPRDDSRTEEGHIRVVTVCELVHWDKKMSGTRVRVQAEYFTDFHHGAFLSDPKCPSARLQLGVRSTEADASLDKFDKALGQHYDYYVGRKFKVDIAGGFVWEEARVLYKELPPNRQLRIPAHGEISIFKVWNFEKPASHGSE